MRLLTSLIAFLVFAAPAATFAQVFNLNQVSSSPYYGILTGDGTGSHKAVASSTPFVKGLYATSTVSATTICLLGDSCRTTWPAGGSGSTVGTVSTSTTPTIGQLAYWTSTAYPSLLGTVGTSSVTISAPLTSSGTAGAVVGGSSWAIGCQTASGSQAGCLSSSDWTIFNSKNGWAYSYTMASHWQQTTAGTSTALWLQGSPFSLFASSTAVFTNASTTMATIASSWWVPQTSALLSADANGKIGSYAGGSCTNQFVRSLNGAGTVTCATVANADLANSSLTVTAGTGMGGGGSVSLGSSVTISQLSYIATSAAETNGQLAYWTTTSGTPAKLGTVATTTLSVSGPLGITAGRGTLVGGSNATISWSGLATTTAISSGQVLYGTSVSGVSSVATSSQTCTAPLACAAFNHIGTGGAITWTGLATTTAISSGQVLYGTSVSGVSSAATSSLAVNSSLSVASGALGFQIGGSNATFGLNLGNANSWTALQSFVNASTSLLSSAVLFTNYINATSTTATSTFSGGVAFSGTIQLSAAQPATSTAIVIDWANSKPQLEYQIGTSATTITVINATTSTQWGSRKLVYVCNPGTTAGAVTWAGVEWIGSAPTQTTTANQCDVYSFDITRATSTTAYKVAGTMGAGFQ